MTIVFHDDYIKHIQGNRLHPESPERVKAIRSSLEEHGLWKNILVPEPLPEEDLALVHTNSHIQRLKNFGEGALDPDTYMREETYGIARLAAGGSVLAMEQTIATKKPAFVFPRPPGHHAGPDYCCGFCYFNNIAIAAKKFLPELGKVAIVDIDVHHGNGTNDIFYEDPDVLFISTHQNGIFPGTGHYNETGRGEGAGRTINIPLEHNAGDSSLQLAFDAIILKTLEQFQPSAILVSLGTDAHYNDPLSSTRMSSLIYTSAVKQLMAFARENCDGQILINLEGGYHVKTLAEIMSNLVAFATTGEDTPLEYTRVLDTTQKSAESILQARDAAAEFWDL